MARRRRLRGRRRNSSHGRLHSRAGVFRPGARRAASRAALVWLVVLVAGTIADVDALSESSGRRHTSHWHHTYTHSLLVSLVARRVLTIVYLSLTRESTSAPSLSGRLVRDGFARGLLHLAMDACQSEGVALFWPFSARRIAADWLASVDPWIIAILISAVLLPELLAAGQRRDRRERQKPARPARGDHRPRRVDFSTLASAPASMPTCSPPWKRAATEANRRGVPPHSRNPYRSSRGMASSKPTALCTS